MQVAPIQGNEASSLLPALGNALLPPLIALAIAWAIGLRLAARWGLWQKRREETLARTSEFYHLYGEFFAVWKLWNISLSQSATQALEERHWKLLERAAAAEASMETMMVKLAAERVLSAHDIATLGSFRQAYQSLREVIRAGKELDWSYSDHPEYLAFKQLAVSVARLVSEVDIGPVPTVEQARESLKVITSNSWEGHWALESP